VLTVGLLDAIQAVPAFLLPASGRRISNICRFSGYSKLRHSSRRRSGGEPSLLVIALPASSRIGFGSVAYPGWLLLRNVTAVGFSHNFNLIVK
jgi:hypothetical protein